MSLSDVDEHSDHSDHSYSGGSGHSIVYSDDSYDPNNSNIPHDNAAVHTNNKSNNLVATNSNSKCKIHHNVPTAIEHFIGKQHESIFGSVYEDITVDNMYPFIVLLGPEGIGKSCISKEICHELLEENNKLFCDGILYLDLLKMHKQDKCETFEQCIIQSIKESHLNTENYDDWFDVTTQNVCSKVHEYLQKSLIVFEDFDRFKEANNLSLEECNKFLFDLFENISMTTKILITSRHKLPIYYNFNMFVTKFYKIDGFDRLDAINWLSSYCQFEKIEIEPYLDDVRDLTAYKPSYLYSIYKLWQNVRAFESTFYSLIHLYSQLEKPQLLIHHNPFNDKSDFNKIISTRDRNQNAMTNNQKPKNILTKNTLSPTNVPGLEQSFSMTSVSVSTYSGNSSSPSYGVGSGGTDLDTPLPDTPPDTNLDVMNSAHGKQPLFGYIAHNLYHNASRSPSKSYHSPMSTMNNNNFDYPWMNNRRRSGSISTDGKEKKKSSAQISMLPTRNRATSDVQDFYIRNSPKKQFYKGTSGKKSRLSWTEKYSLDENEERLFDANACEDTPPLDEDNISRLTPGSLTPIFSNKSSADFEDILSKAFKKPKKKKRRSFKKKKKKKKKKSNKYKKKPELSLSIAEEPAKIKKHKSNESMDSKRKKYKKMITTQPKANSMILMDSYESDELKDLEIMSRKPIVHKLSENNLKSHSKRMSLIPTDTTKNEISEFMSLAIAENRTTDDDEDEKELEEHIGNKHTKKETYDGFLSALGAEIHRQQKVEDDNHSHSHYKISVNDVDISTPMSPIRPLMPPSGYLHAFDLPATPPLSCAGVVTDGSRSELHLNWNYDNEDDDILDDNISVNSEYLKQNKLMSISLMNDENNNHHHHNNNAKLRKKRRKSHKKRKKMKNKATNSSKETKLKIGNVYFNKYLRMTLLLNINIDTWSRPWLINGIARSLRTQDIRFSVHKAQGIANDYSYVSLLCRCDEYDIKQIKNTFEFVFISHELEKCISESLGQNDLKVICASCVSYRDYQYLYSKDFLRWIANSLPPAFEVDVGFSSEESMPGSSSAILKVSRQQYEFKGMSKMSLMNADYIQLPFSQKDLNSTDAMNEEKRQLFDKKFGVNMMNKHKDKDKKMCLNERNGILTPPNMTVLHFMSTIL